MASTKAGLNSRAERLALEKEKSSCEPYFNGLSNGRAGLERSHEISPNFEVDKFQPDLLLRTSPKPIGSVSLDCFRVTRHSEKADAERPERIRNEKRARDLSKLRLERRPITWLGRLNSTHRRIWFSNKSAICWLFSLESSPSPASLRLPEHRPPALSHPAPRRFLPSSSSSLDPAILQTARRP